jgi:hypothetical protein
MSESILKILNDVLARIKNAAIMSRLRVLLPDDTITLEFMGCGDCFFIQRKNGRVYVMGDVNELWGADRYNSQQRLEMGAPDGYVECSVPVESNDGLRIADMMFLAIISDERN